MSDHIRTKQEGEASYFQLSPDWMDVMEEIKNIKIIYYVEKSKLNGYWKDEFNIVVAQINTANGFISPPSEWLEYANCSMNVAEARNRLCYDCNRQFIEDEDNYKQGWVSTKCNRCI